MSPAPYQARKRRLYTEHAPHYDAGIEAIVGEEVLHQRLDWAAEVIEAGQRILDLGCGTGHLLPRLAENVGTAGCVVGADLCSAMLDIARPRIAGVHERVSLLVLDATDRLPFASESFDCVCAFGLLQEVAAPRSLLEEAHRIIKPGGAFRGLATTYRTLSEAAEVHMAAAEEMAFFFRPQNTIASMFLQIFGPAAATRWQPNPNLTDPSVWARLPVQPMHTVLENVRQAGHDPASVELGVLLMTGRRLP